jgi:HSP20 family protein
MTHLKHSVLHSVRAPYLPILKGSPPVGFFDYDRFFHLPWGHAFPPVNVKEDGKSFEIELMVPGYDKGDFNISVDEEFLNVSAESKHEGERKENDYTQKQFGFTSFSRSFHLPPNANDEDIQAKYDGGVLKLTIAKKNINVVKPKKAIEVV